MKRARTAAFQTPPHPRPAVLLHLLGGPHAGRPDSERHCSRARTCVHVARSLRDAASSPPCAMGQRARALGHRPPAHACTHLAPPPRSGRHLRPAMQQQGGQDPLLRHHLCALILLSQLVRVQPGERRTRPDVACAEAQACWRAPGRQHQLSTPPRTHACLLQDREVGYTFHFPKNSSSVMWEVRVLGARWAGVRAGSTLSAALAGRWRRWGPPAAAHLLRALASLQAPSTSP